MKAKIYFLPLLLLYLVIIIAYNNNLQGDEGRYLTFARNLSHGYYSPPNNIDLWNGPGYPLLLAPLVILKLDSLPIRLLNAFLLYIAVIYFFNTLRMYLNRKYALYISYILGIYPPVLRDLPMILTETFVIFLICGFSYHFCKLMQSGGKNRFQLIISSLYLAFIALTKIIFGYVIITSIVIFLIASAIKRRKSVEKVLAVNIIAMLFCLPYLFYTYSLTGKMFYWGTSGGMSFYWMSTPYSGEFGNWYDWSQVYAEPQLSANHHEFFDRIAQMDNVRRDEEFKKQALINIREHPQKFLTNWMCNLGRLLFSYPFSYKLQSPSTFYYLIPNMFLVVLAILCVYPTIIRYHNLPFEIIILLLISLIYLGGSTLLSAYERQLRPVFPILFLWISFTLLRIVEIRLPAAD